MDQHIQPDVEVQSLRRCINDLVSVLALPAIWSGGPAQIVETLARTLMRLLDVDFVYARHGAVDVPGSPSVLKRISNARLPDDLGARLEQWYGEQRQGSDFGNSRKLGDTEYFLQPLRLGIGSGAGLLVAGSRRPDFPRQTDTLLLTVAANQAAIALQEGEIREQQARAAAELDLRVTRRTEELACAVDELRSSRLHLMQMTETIPGMLWSATADGMVDYCNGRLLEYAGFAPHEVMGTNWVKLLHPDDVEPTSRVWLDCIRTGKPYRVQVRTYFAKENNYRWCVTDALPLIGSDGAILKWYGTVVDVHDWRLALEELRATQGELAYVARAMTLGELTASIAHELNQPLAGIVTNAHTGMRMLAADQPNIAGARETLQRTIRDANRAAGVITRLRALYARREPTPEPVDLNEATREVLDLCHADLVRNHVTLRLELSRELPAVVGDRVQLQQVILNLIGNANDAMSVVADRARELMIATGLDETGAARVIVRDSGVGFTAEDAEKIFSAFYTTKKNGMGIGLSVSRSIIQSHRGRLWANSAPGMGSVFMFTIPLADTPAPPN